MRTTIYPPASKESAASADIVPIGDSSAVDTADLDLEPASFSDAAAVAAPLPEAIFFSTVLFIILWKMPSNTIILVEK